GRGAGGPDQAQQPAWHLYQLRQSAGARRARGTGGDAGRRHAVRDYAGGTRRPRRRARRDRARLPWLHRPPAWRYRGAPAATWQDFGLTWLFGLGSFSRSWLGFVLPTPAGRQIGRVSNPPLPVTATGLGSVSQVPLWFLL